METIKPFVSNEMDDSDVIELWLSRQRSPLTRSVYQRDINRLLAATKSALAETTALDLERFADALAGSAGSNLPGPNARRCPQLLPIRGTHRVLQERSGPA
jgi:hypothetical protein